MISPPACAGCGKDLATMQRRGQDWYCGVCGPRARALRGLRQHPARWPSATGTGSRDARSCPPDDGQDPAAEIVEDRRRGIDPALPAGP